MRLIPKSLFWRLLAISTIATLAALIFAAFSIGHVLERFVMRGLDERLDAQIAIVARAVRPDGTVDPALAADLPPFDRPGSGWAWEIRAPRGTARSRSLAGGDLPLPPAIPRGHRRPRENAGEPRPFEADDGQGRRLHYRALTVSVAAGDALIIAAGPREIVERPLREAMLPLLLSLGLLGLGLAAATLVQLRFGLRPLHALRRGLSDVRAGRLRHVDPDQPAELQPLVRELNALIDENAAGLAGARAHLANLAHGIKTPLAALVVELAEPGRDPDGRLRALVARIEDSARHHLGRARAATQSGPRRVATPLAARISDLVAVLARIHAERPIAAEVAIDPAITVACDPQDVDEIAGNLLDNGWRWARGRIAISAARRGAMVDLVIEDDGPGIPEAELDAALQPGRRLDERPGGHGFGLSIARELAELYGGGIVLEKGDLGGLRVRVTLPAPVG